MLWKTLAVSILIWLPTGGFASAEAKAAAPFIWWSPAPVERLADGHARQTLILETSPGTNFKRPEAWLRVTPLKRFNQAGEPAKAYWQRGEWTSSSPWTLAIKAGEYVIADVFAKAEIAGQPHFAQTRLLLYGKTKKNESGLKELDAAPSAPEFQMRSNGEFYWPQTGHEFTFTLDGLKAAVGGLEVWNAQGELVDTVSASAGVFKYTPAHDPALNQGGYAARKDLVFVARSASGESVAFTLAVHRSRTAGLNKWAGLAVFTGTFLLSGLAVGLVRLKESPCC